MRNEGGGCGGVYIERWKINFYWASILALDIGMNILQKPKGFSLFLSRYWYANNKLENKLVFCFICTG